MKPTDFDRPKWVAVVTGVLALALSIGYLLLVQLLDFRGEFKPAPIEPLGLTVVQLHRSVPVATLHHSGFDSVPFRISVEL